MKFQDLKKKNKEELTKEFAATELDLMKYNAKVATNSIGKDAGKIKQLRKTIARIKTLQNEKPVAKTAPKKAVKKA
jgi:ribosomal protein L29